MVDPFFNTMILFDGILAELIKVLGAILKMYSFNALCQIS